MFLIFFRGLSTLLLYYNILIVKYLLLLLNAITILKYQMIDTGNCMIQLFFFISSYLSKKKNQLSCSYLII